VTTKPLLQPNFRSFGRAATLVSLAIIATYACVGTGSGDRSAGGAEHPAAGQAKPGNDLQLFILFGQSNMEGAAAAEAEDKTINERVFVLGYDTDDKCLGRNWNEWSLAQPPLHRCFAGLGPGDWFAKTLADTWTDAQIGLVPNAISGVDIDFFRKGVVSTRRKEFQIPPDNQREGAYDLMIERARLAQQRGRIRGILFHQGESDTGKTEWLDKVAEIVGDLRKDLELDAAEVPFIAGELPYEACCSSHNPIVNQLPQRIPNAHVVSAEGLGLKDRFHFDAAGQREMGKRYAAAFLNAIENPAAATPASTEATAP
jgi:hypothetical protein